jgi:hypothetical protein
LLSIQKTTWLNIPEGSNAHSHHHDSLKPHLFSLIYVHIYSSKDNYSLIILGLPANHYVTQVEKSNASPLKWVIQIWTAVGIDIPVA